MLQLFCREHYSLTAAGIRHPYDTTYGPVTLFSPCQLAFASVSFPRSADCCRVPGCLEFVMAEPARAAVAHGPHKPIYLIDLVS